MKTSRSLCAGIALGAFLGLCGAARASSVTVGSEAPNFSGTWFNYESTSLKNLRGMAVLVEFWGTT
jgi:hypothetical protein